MFNIPIGQEKSAFTFLNSINVLLLLTLATRLLWLGYTQFTYEDAYITFRYAQQLAAGHGWAHNTGEPIYGTTTPLLTLLLAGWLWVRADLVLGARIIDLGATVGAVALLWGVLGRLKVARWLQVGALVAVIGAEKLIIRDTGGMETPLVIVLMVASWYALVCERPIWAGVAAGLLLWTRIDTFPWIAALAIGAWWTQRRLPWRFLGVAALTYLPWVIFATIRFGSPIPYTVIAKNDAYVNTGVPLLQHLSTVLQRRITAITLLDLPRGWAIWTAIIGTYLLALWGAWRTHTTRWLLVLPLFIALDTATRVLSRSTFDTRYFIPATWAILVLIGLGGGAALHGLWYQRGWGKPVAIGVCSAVCILNLVWAAQWASYFRTYQSAVQDGALTAIGHWLHTETPPGATVMLELLGYVGYYADRHMIDEVGLISPQIVALRQQGITDICAFTERIKPDYLLSHCDDAIRRIDECDLNRRHRRVFQVNPLHFDPASSPGESTAEELIPRLACYEIWQTVTTPANS